MSLFGRFYVYSNVSIDTDGAEFSLKVDHNVCQAEDGVNFRALKEMGDQVLEGTRETIEVGWYLTPEFVTFPRNLGPYLQALEG